MSVLPLFEVVMKGNDDYRIYDNKHRCFIVDEDGKPHTWSDGWEAIITADKMFISAVIREEEAYEKQRVADSLANFL